MKEMQMSAVKELLFSPSKFTVFFNQETNESEGIE